MDKVILRPIEELAKTNRRREQVLMWFANDGFPDSSIRHVVAVMMSFEDVTLRRCWQDDFVEPVGWSEMPEFEVAK